MIHSYMSKLLKSENITDLKHVCGLRKLFGTIDMQVRSLENLGYEPDRQGSLLVPILTSEIPDVLHLIISKKFDSADNLLYVLKTEITAQEKTVLVPKQGENVFDE